MVARHEGEAGHQGGAGKSCPRVEKASKEDERKQDQMSDKNRFEIQGLFSRLEKFTSKGGKEFLTLILDVDGEDPQVVPIKLWGKTAEQARSWKEGDELLVIGRLRGRVWNGKVYGDIVAETVDVMSGEDPLGKPADEPPADDGGSSIPF